MIMTETEITVAAMDKRIMNLENDRCWLKAIRRAINEEMFTINSYSMHVLSEPIGAINRLAMVREPVGQK
jgi:hypothetical protein